MAMANKMKGSKDHVVAVAGDAAFTCGPTFEALNNVSNLEGPFIIVLNDNEWSIDKNVGAIAKYFNKITTSKAYAGLHAAAANFVSKRLGDKVSKIASKVEKGAKNVLVPSVLFEEFGLRYYGPIDGHDLPLLIKTIEFLKEKNEPVILHIITENGHG